MSIYVRSKRAFFTVGWNSVRAQRWSFQENGDIWTCFGAMALGTSVTSSNSSFQPKLIQTLRLQAEILFPSGTRPSLWEDAISRLVLFVCQCTVTPPFERWRVQRCHCLVILSLVISSNRCFCIPKKGPPRRRALKRPTLSHIKIGVYWVKSWKKPAV